MERRCGAVRCNGRLEGTLSSFAFEPGKFTVQVGLELDFEPSGDGQDDERRKGRANSPPLPPSTGEHSHFAWALQVYIVRVRVGLSGPGGLYALVPCRYVPLSAHVLIWYETYECVPQRLGRLSLNAGGEEVVVVSSSR